jgi:hypothetical protein
MQKNRRNQRIKGGNAKGQSEMADRGQGVRLNLVSIFSTKIQVEILPKNKTLIENIMF